ncbi:hypothetical protein ACKKBF_B39945 [Auxenochlorella protothecoides x Auxenochlorella symbiontica]
MQHVCDANCDQGVYYDGAHVICRLSKVVRPLSTVEHVVRKRSGDLLQLPGSKRNSCEPNNLPEPHACW